MKNQKCENCIYSHMILRSSGETYECRKNVPVLLVGNQWGMFPWVSKNDWCGQWEWSGKKSNNPLPSNE